MTPFLSAFVRGLRQQGMDNDQIQKAATAAINKYPDLKDELENILTKAAILDDTVEGLTNTLNSPGGNLARSLAAIGSFIPGVNAVALPASVAMAAPSVLNSVNKGRHGEALAGAAGMVPATTPFGMAASIGGQTLGQTMQAASDMRNPSFGQPHHHEAPHLLGGHLGGGHLPEIPKAAMYKQALPDIFAQGGAAIDRGLRAAGSYVKDMGQRLADAKAPSLREIGGGIKNMTGNTGSALGRLSGMAGKAIAPDATSTFMPGTRSDMSRGLRQLGVGMRKHPYLAGGAALAGGSYAAYKALSKLLGKNEDEESKRYVFKFGSAAVTAPVTPPTSKSGLGLGTKIMLGTMAGTGLLAGGSVLNRAMMPEPERDTSTKYFLDKQREHELARQQSLLEKMKYPNL